MNASSATAWNAPPPSPILSDDEVHVWRFSLERSDRDRYDLFQTLSPDERRRAKRLVKEQKRRHFVAGRGVLRAILGRYLNREPSKIGFRYGFHGKPELDSGGDLQFNLSHSGEGALLALTRGRELGIDLERLRRMANFEQLARRYFAAEEVADLASVPPGEREQAFFNCWTRKEAYIKACGDGLAQPLDRFAVSLRPGEPARMRHIAGDVAEATFWTLTELPPWPGYAASLAVRDHSWRLRCWLSDPDV